MPRSRTPNCHHEDPAAGKIRIHYPDRCFGQQPMKSAGHGPVNTAAVNKRTVVMTRYRVKLTSWLEAVASWW